MLQDAKRAAIYGNASDFEVELEDGAPRYGGKEIRLREYWHQEGDDASYPTLVRETAYRYHAQRDRDIRYRRSVYTRTIITVRFTEPYYEPQSVASVHSALERVRQPAFVEPMRLGREPFLGQGRGPVRGAPKLA